MYSILESFRISLPKLIYPMINNLEGERSLNIDLYFEGFLSPLARVRLITLTEAWIRARSGLSFEGRVKCGFFRATFTTKKKLTQHLLKKAPSETFWDNSFSARAIERGSQERWGYERLFSFFYAPVRLPESRYMLLKNMILSQLIQV